MFSGIDHIDIAVEDVEQMAKFFVQLGFVEKRRTQHGGGSVELQFPGAQDVVLELTPVRRAENGVPGLRHIAMRCDNIHEAHAALEAQGYQFASVPHQNKNTGRWLMDIVAPEGRPLQVAG